MKKIFLLISILGMVLSLCLVLMVTAEADPDPGIVGQWHFDEIFTDGAGVQTTPDSSGLGNTGTLMPLGSEPPLAPGMFNTAISFNGTNQWVDCGPAVDDSITTELTLAAWIKDDGISDNHLFIISNDYTHGIKKGYDFFLWPDGRLYADVGTGVLGRVSCEMPVDTLWHHVAVTWDGTTVTLYFDGNPVGTAPLIGSYSDPGKNTYIGKFNWPSNYYPNGMIDEVLIWDQALTADEIAALASRTCVTRPDGLVSWWPGDEDAGDIQDGNHGTLENGAMFAAEKVGLGFSFDGVDDYVNVGNDVSLTGADAGTIDAWIFVPSDTLPNTSLAILGYGGDAIDEAFIASVRTNEDSSAFQVGLFTERAPYKNKNELSTDNYFSTGFFHHVAWLSDGSAYKLFVDGAEESFSVLQGYDDGEWLGDIFPAPNDIVTIGTRKYERLLRFFFYGIIDEVEIFNHALSQEEIQAIVDAGPAGKCKTIQVDIDIKPGSYPNAINLGSHGSIPVAILSSEDFDATTVDPDTVELAGAGIAVRGKGNKYMAHVEDVNGDGLDDLVIQVETENLDPDSFQDGKAVLTGATYDGKAIEEGSDEIFIVPKG